MFSSDKLIPLERDSKLQWKGLTSQKFLETRRHFNIGESTNVSLPSLGRKHYMEKFDRPQAYKSCLKVFPDKRNIESAEYFQSKKLIYVPAQKKSKPFKIKMSGNGKTIKVFTSDSNRMNWKEKEKAEAMKEDMQSVYELNNWEHKIRKLLDPFYIAQPNDENDD